MFFSDLILELGMAQRKFAQCLGEFHFEYIGDAKTDDEKCIGKYGFASKCNEKLNTGFIPAS